MGHPASGRVIGIERRSGPVVAAAVAEVAARIAAGVERSVLEAAARVRVETSPAPACILKRTEAAEIGLAAGQGGCLGGAERTERFMPALESVHQSIADHHAAGDARSRREGATQEAASARSPAAAHHAGLLTAPGTGLRP